MEGRAARRAAAGTCPPGSARGGRSTVAKRRVELALFYTSEFRWWSPVDIVGSLTGLIRWCPLYAPLEITTCSSSGE